MEEKIPIKHPTQGGLVALLKDILSGLFQKAFGLSKEKEP